MTEKTLTTENIKPALDALRGELAPWPVVAKKQDRLSTAQLNAANSGITSSLVAQITANTAAIRTLESAITGTGLRALVVAALPAVGTTGILYIVPVTTYDPDTDADVVNYSNEYIWIPVEGGTASEGHYEQVGQTGIVINNGQLTITVNGTSVGTFTANQSGDTTAAITVPTNADYVDRTTNQTVAGDKTWTGEQSFTLPIVGSITGTASKAIADEDGTSIKTGYVNVAGNQTVTGNKEWTGTNTYTNNFYFKDSTVVKGTAVTSDRAQNIWDVIDSNDVSFGTWQAVQYSNNRQGFRLAVSNNYLNGALDPTGTSIPTYFQFLQTGGSAILKWNDGFVDNSVLPIANSYSLGSAYFQWSSVYAQNYYYNGTEFQSKFVTTDTSQTINADKEFYYNKYLRVGGYRFSIKNSSYEKGVIPSTNQWTAFNFVDKYNNPFFTVEYGNISNGRVIFKFTASTNEENPSNIEFFTYQYKANDSNFISVSTDFIPKTTAVTDLGTSTNKWKTLNGVNPGALGMPSNTYTGSNAIVEIDRTGWVYDGTANSYSPPVDCWLSISNGGAITVWGVNTAFGMKATDNIAIPLRLGETYSVSLTHIPDFCRIYPCLGNV